MEWFDHLRIKTKILTSFIAVAFIEGIVGVIGIYHMIKINSTDAALVASDKAVVILILAVITEIIVTIVLGLITVHTITKPIKNLAGLIELAHQAPVAKEMAETVQRLASGDLDFEVSPQSDHDVFAMGINTVITTLKKITAETELARESFIQGDLNHRCDTKKFDGEYKRILSSINLLIDTLVCPIHVSTEYFERISKGEIPEKVEADAKGNISKLNHHINACIDSISMLTIDAEMLSIEITKGNLDMRTDSTRHKGNHAKLLKDFNHALDSIIHPLHIAAAHIEQIGKGEIPEKITEEYQGNFNSIKNSINACIDGLNGLMEGKLALEQMRYNDFTAKVDGSYQGIFAEISESINMISDRILHIIDILGKISDGNLEDLARLESSGKKCENDTLSPTLVTLMGNIKSLADETHILSTAAVEGKLTKRGDTEKFKGEYSEIIRGINQTLDAVTESSSEVINVLKEVTNGNLQATVKGDYRGDHAAIKNAINETIENIREYVNEISSVLSGISNGNLDIEITMEHKGDFVEIGDSLQNIITTLNQVMNNFGNSADEVSASSKQVSSSSQFLAQGSTEQASSIQELTASIGEIAEQSKDNAIKANEVYHLAKGARDGGAKGNQTMNEMLESMKDINDSSINISKIIKVIDDIAFQTNILALNAAVEAARAGNHGKGFAVVAEEVRNLAARSAKAAEETTELIEGSIQKVQIGTKITNEIAAVLKEIADGAVISTEKLNIIAKASNEQASGIAQINQGIEQISHVVQNNSATAEQSAASSEELSGQAELLKEMVSRFKVKGEVANTRLLTDSSYRLEQAKINLTDNQYDKY